MKIFIGIGIGLVVVLIVVLLMGNNSTNYEQDISETENVSEEVAQTQDTPEPVVEEPVWGEAFTYGTSVEGRELTGYTYGSGENKLVFIGAIHGGYEWNTALLANKLKDYLTENTEVVPSDIQMIVIPAANPDGLFKIVGTADEFVADDVSSNTVPGRFNANEVDINRNFDCNWQAEATWRSETVDAGDSAFSEPETVALRDYLLEVAPSVVVFWHSSSDGVYTSYCNDEISDETLSIGTIYSEASGYPLYETFDYYVVTGDAGDWLASVGIPAISVELTTHEVVEWEKNLDGITALIDFYSTE